MRILMFAAIAAAMVSAVALYAVSQQTRQLADANQEMEREIRTLSRNISILRAERAYLTRAERIEPLARQLGMRPVNGRQFMAKGALGAHMRKGQ